MARGLSRSRLYTRLSVSRRPFSRGPNPLCGGSARKGGSSPLRKTLIGSVHAVLPGGVNNNLFRQSLTPARVSQLKMHINISESGQRPETLGITSEGGIKERGIGLAALIRHLCRVVYSTGHPSAGQPAAYNAKVIR